MRREIETNWSIAGLAKRLYINEGEAASILQALSGRGLISCLSEQQGGTVYRYSPDPPELENLVNATADSYAKYLIPLTHLVHTKSVTSARQFADAFRLKGKP